jgi:molybdopterin/thiamine biosynthesis adenylyltransferase
VPRTDRYADILKFDHLITPITVVGCGAIGRQVALMLASMGFDTIRLIDPDEVDDSNLGTQGWSIQQLEEKKTKALSAEMADRFNECCVSEYPRKIQEVEVSSWDRTAVFMCVDCMDVRKYIYDTLMAESSRRCKYLIDTRMGAAAGYVWPVNLESAHSRATWEEGWFPQEEAEPMPCAARSTLYCATYAASLAVSSLVNMVRGQGTLSVPVHFNLPANILARV